MKRIPGNRKGCFAMPLLDKPEPEAVILKTKRVRRRDGTIETVLAFIRCPLCGVKHMHGLGPKGDLVGSRVAHCVTGQGGNYRLVWRATMGD